MGTALWHGTRARPWMPDVSSLTAQLKELQATLVRALQEEYYCDDLEPPDAAFGWSEDRLREFFESGGEAASAEQPAASGQAAKAPVTPGQPGGGRVQPELLVNPAFEAPPLASTLKELVGGSGVQKAEVYQDSVIAAGIPPLADGLFPPDDPLLKELSSQFKPYTKALATQTVGGGYAFRQVEAGWCVGSHAAAHGIDLRLFVARGKEPKLLGALRYSDGALIGRGFAGAAASTPDPDLDGSGGRRPRVAQRAPSSRPPTP